MANKNVALAGKFLREHPQMISLEDFLAGFVNLPRRLPMECTMVEIEHMAQREFDRRAEVTQPSRKPLSNFVLEPLKSISINGKRKLFPSGYIHVYSLHPTKGWRPSKTDAAERDHAVSVKKYPLLREWPKHDYRHEIPA